MGYTMRFRHVSSDDWRSSVHRSRRTVMYAIMLTIVFICIEILSLAAINLINLPPGSAWGKPTGIFYDPSMVTQNYGEYLQKRDINLGWVQRPPDGPINKPENTTADGARRDPIFPIGERACVSLFGDSFTWSTGVADKDAWGSLLAVKLRCRVANFGVGGYGTDQAFLRFRLLPPKGRIVFLNHLSENILRNVNQFRNLLYPGHEFMFKPRFVYRNSGIALLSTPDIAASDIRTFLDNPARYLADEYFLPGGPSGVQMIEFPYSLTLLKVALTNYRIHAKLTGVPPYADFYRAEHSSHSLDVTYGILRSFALEAATRDQMPIITLIPTRDDFKFFDTAGVFPYDRLIKMVAAKGIRYIDFGDQIANRIKGSKPEDLYDVRTGHFNEAGNRLLADIAFEELMRDPEAGRRLLAEH